MGRFGRIPKPRKLRELEGTPSWDLSPPPAQPRAYDGPPPEGLSAGARKHWEELAPHLRAAGRLTVFDVTALVMLCENLAHLERTERELAELPITEDKHRVVAQFRNQLLRSVLNLAKEFGLTPLSRARLPEPPEEDPQKLREALTAPLGGNGQE